MLGVQLPASAILAAEDVVVCAVTDTRRRWGKHAADVDSGGAGVVAIGRGPMGGGG